MSGFHTFVNVIGGLGIGFVILRIIGTAKAYGRRIWRGMAVMTSITLRGPKKALILLASFLLLTQTLFPQFLSDWIPPIAASFGLWASLGISLIGISAGCLPPSILYLAASGEQGAGVLRILQSAAMPLKVVHLLQSHGLPDLEINQFRVSNDWQSAIRNLAAISPVIVIDGRIRSDHVATEFEHLINSGLHLHTFIVTNDDGGIPALLGKATSRDFNPFISTPGTFYKGIASFGWSFLFSPEPNLAIYLEKSILRFRKLIV